MDLDRIALLDWEDDQSLHRHFTCIADLQALLPPADVGIHKCFTHDFLCSYFPFGCCLTRQIDNWNDSVIELHEFSITTNNRNHLTKVTGHRVSIITLAKGQPLRIRGFVGAYQRNGRRICAQQIPPSVYELFHRLSKRKCFGAWLRRRSQQLYCARYAEQGTRRICDRI